MSNEQNEVRLTSREKSKKGIASLVISAMMLALAIAIKFITKAIPFLNLPYGGSITLVLLPLIYCSLICGPIWGGSISLGYAIINFFIDGVVSWTTNTAAIILTLLLDYVIPYAVVALAGFLKKPFYQKKLWTSVVAVACTYALKFVSHFFSGVIIWNQLFSGEGPLVVDFSLAGIIYSLQYNGFYILISVVLNIIVSILLYRVISRAIDLPILKTLKPKDLIQDEGKTYYSEIMVYLQGASLLLSIISSISGLKVFFLGYVSLALSLLILACLIYNNVKLKTTDKLNITTYVLIAITIGVSLLGILSRYTYALPYYNVEEPA